jgi:hypothetical protein
VDQGQDVDGDATRVEVGQAEGFRHTVTR